MRYALRPVARTKLAVVESDDDDDDDDGDDDVGDDHSDDDQARPRSQTCCKNQVGCLHSG